MKRFMTLFICLILLAGCSRATYRTVDVENIDAEIYESEKAEADEDIGRRALADIEGTEEISQDVSQRMDETGENAEEETETPTMELATQADMADLFTSPIENDQPVKHVVAVDADRQAKADSEKEPVGPSSETMKARMAEGATGGSLGIKEYELTLSVALKLEDELIGRGYEVVMIRDSNDVDISNAERAVTANNSGAEIYIRLHANSMENSGIYGVLTMCMTEENPYNARLHDKSYDLSKRIVDQICIQTGTRNRGVQQVDNLTAINWSEIPVSDVAIGFLSNPDEERWLASDDYQEKIVKGIANAVDAYFSSDGYEIITDEAEVPEDIQAEG